MAAPTAAGSAPWAACATAAAIPGGNACWALAIGALIKNIPRAAAETASFNPYLKVTISFRMKTLLILSQAPTLPVN
jgi:hypothetical protein